MHLDDSGNATPIMALIVAALETELGIDLPDPTPAAAYAGGDPVMTEPGLVMERVAAFTLPTDEFEPFLTDTEIWEVVSPWDEAYARNVPEVVALVLELDMDPADCPATCGISVTGDQPGVPPIDPSPTLPVWIPGNGVVSEQTWFPDGQFVDVFLNGDGAGGFQRFANPANVVLHSNRDRHFYIGVVPYVATGVAAFNSETRDPLGAYHQYVPVGDIAPFPGESVEEVLAELLGGG